MGDMADDFRLMRKTSQDKRASNRLASADLLRSKGVEFEERNFGAHLLVKHEGRKIDFWPGTGRWIDRAHPFSCINGRGVAKLLQHIGKAKGEA